MPEYELYHWGIKDMKWGIRRFQRKDGSLTPEGKKRYNDSSETETVESKRAKLLKSTDAGELYKNRALLSTNEINDRLNRISAEQRLADIAASNKQAGQKRISSMLQTSNKIMTDVWNFMNNPMVKAVSSKLFGKSEKINALDDLKKAFSNNESMSTDELNSILRRYNTVKSIEKAVDDAMKKK